MGGAQKLVTPTESIALMSAEASNLAKLHTRMVASAIHGAKKLDHACLAHPGDATLRWMSPGSRPIQYIVERWPTG